MLDRGPEGAAIQGFDAPRGCFDRDLGSTRYWKPRHWITYDALDNGRIIEILLYPDDGDPPYLRVRHDKRRANTLKQLDDLKAALLAEDIIAILCDDPVDPDVAESIVRCMMEESLDLPDDVVVALLHPNRALTPVYQELVQNGVADTVLNASRYVSRFCSIIDHLRSSPVLAERIATSGVPWYTPTEAKQVLRGPSLRDYDVSRLP